MENTLAELSEDRAKERPYSPSNDANSQIARKATFPGAAMPKHNCIYT